MKNVSILHIIFLTGVVLIGFACSKNNSTSTASSQSFSAPSTKSLSLGDWGVVGSDSRVLSIFTVNENGATLDLGCGLGTISSRPLVDKDGFFEVEGVFQIQGGAQPIDGFPEVKAYFRGQVIDDKLQLTYRLEGSTVENTSVFTFGATGQLLRCL